MEGSIPVIAGCTASGKSHVAMQIAEQLPGIEIVSADSRQFYRGMNIGTAKPSPEEMQRVKHHMIDITDPDNLVSAGWFAEAASNVIEEILARGGTPLIVGGSALYIMSLAGLIDKLPERNDTVREALKILEAEIPGSLHRMLCSIDSAEANSIGSRDEVRLVRSLEIAILSGEKPSALKKGGRVDHRYRFALIDRDSATLRRRIEERTARMMQNGLPEEVEGLLKDGYSREPVLGATIGYSELLDYFEGKCSLEEAESRIAVNTWRYARRQRNMFRRLPGAVTTGNSLDGIMDVLFRERIAHG